MLVKPPCCIVTGFLGSGKTTLLQHLLRTGSSRSPVAVVMNELGDVGIDGQVFTGFDSVEKMVELNSGCVCCMISEYQLAQALDEITEEVAPLLIIIETTGVAEPQPIAARLQSLGYLVESIVTVVDAVTFPGPSHSIELVHQQLLPADFIIINKADLVQYQRLSDLESRIAATSPRARIVRARFGNVDPHLVFGAPAKVRPGEPSDSTGHNVAAHAHHPGHLDTFSFVSSNRFDLERLWRTLTSLPASVYRAKGIVNPSGDGNPVLFNFVCGRLDHRDLLPGRRLDLPTQAVFIGELDAGFREHITAQLRSCETPSDSA